MLQTLPPKVAEYLYKTKYFQQGLSNFLQNFETTIIIVLWPLDLGLACNLNGRIFLTHCFKIKKEVEMSILYITFHSFVNSQILIQ